MRTVSTRGGVPTSPPGPSEYGEAARSPVPPGRPPLAKRLRPGHWAALDYVAGALLGVIMFAVIRHSVIAANALPGSYGTPRFRPLPLPLSWPLAVLLILAAAAAAALRRRRPRLMLGILLAGSVVVTLLTSPYTGAALTYFLPVAFVLYLVAATYERKQAAVRVLLAVFATLLVDAVLIDLNGGRGFAPSGLTSVALCVIIAWTIGYVVRQRRRYAVRLQEEAASKAVAQERLRIARELHDVVAHSMSVIAVQAGYGQYVIDTQPDDARAALGAIQATSREALDEMRRMLGALRHADAREAGAGGEAVADAGPAAHSGPGAGAGGEAGRAGGAASGGAGAPLFPAPGLADLDRLVSRTASAGVQVEVKRAGQPRDLPASIDLSAYRIVQEALTNVVKHAQTSSCQVLIGYGDDELTIEVTDNGAGMPVPELAGARASHHGLASHNGSTALSRNGSAARGVATLDDTGTRHDPSVTQHASGRGAAGLAFRLGGAGSPGGHGSPGGGSLGGGHGIIGMRERVTLLGGDFSAGPLPGYGFRVSASIPLPPASA